MLRALLACALVAQVLCWQKWHFTGQTTKNAAGFNTIGPGKRRGHSMALLSTSPCTRPQETEVPVDGESLPCFPCPEHLGGDSLYPSTIDPADGQQKGCDEQKIILFGGRGEDMRREHNPKTYRIEEVNGTQVSTMTGRQGLKEALG